jgi:L-seryl-tRNA(Ser) seleniumtransferase
VDKLTYAALEATLTGPPTPVAAALTVDVATLRRRARALAERLAAAGADARVVDSEATVGGGGAPGVGLPSAGVTVPAELAGTLRHGPAVRAGEVPAVVGYADGNRLLLDLRSVPPEDDELLGRAVITAARGAPATPAAQPTPTG